MKRQKNFLATFVALFLVFMFTAAAENQPVADVMMSSSEIHWQPRINYDQMILTVSGPDGSVFSKTFKDTTPYFDLSFLEGKSLLDGSYTYELRVVPHVSKKMRKAGIEPNIPQRSLTQTGYFTLKNGSIVTTTSEETPDRPLDVLHYDDVIITGSLCVGFDCADGESFGFDTIILKEHNLRIYFNDTSYTASYPTNNWRITINDSTNGGANYFSIDDVDEGTHPFRIEAGAPSNSLYVEDYGRIGIKTSTPVVELHIKDSDTPTVRLEQDSSGGWTPQTWDVAGNESNFFIRDVTNGSKLPFRIQPSTPSSTLCLKSDGKVGIGTWSPSNMLEIETTGQNSTLMFDRTDGARVQFAAKGTKAALNVETSHQLELGTNNTTRMTIAADGKVGIGTTSPSYPLQMGGGAYSDGNDWYPSSSIKYKENINSLDADEAVDALNELNPVKFNYKSNKSDERVGFIAEEVPQLVATNERDGLSPMDVVAVLTKVVQEQQQTISDLKKRIEDLEKK